MTKVAMGGPVADPRPGDPRVGLLPAGAKAEKPATKQPREFHPSGLTPDEEESGTQLCGRNRPPRRPR